VSSKWLKVNVYFPLGLSEEFSISHFQGGETAGDVPLSTSC
jgi:hypothetical protein